MVDGERQPVSVEALSPFGQEESSSSFWRENLVGRVGHFDSSARVKIAAYLKSGTMIMPLMEYTEDIIGRAFGVSGGSSLLSDGSRYWRLDAVDYVSTYGIALDDTSFGEEILMMPEPVAPRLSVEVQQEVFEALVDEGGWT